MPDWVGCPRSSWNLGESTLLEKDYKQYQTRFNGKHFLLTTIYVQPGSNYQFLACISSASGDSVIVDTSWKMEIASIADSNYSSCNCTRTLTVEHTVNRQWYYQRIQHHRLNCKKNATGPIQNPSSHSN